MQDHICEKKKGSHVKIRIEGESCSCIYESVEECFFKTPENLALRIEGGAANFDGRCGSLA